MKKNKLTLPSINIIKNRFIYHEDGYLLWNIDVTNNRIKKGSKVKGKLHKSGKLLYKYIGINGKQYAEHRIIYYLCKNDNPTHFDVDHINKNTLDNRINNLRKVTTAQNNTNKNLYKNNTTGYSGIYEENGRYAATIFHKGKRYRNKTHTTLEKALLAQKEKHKEIKNEPTKK
tara:strand:- start:34 stop:552 length:519 start_codon:yes stop_codon:yes gene_type:complete